MKPLTIDINGYCNLGCEFCYQDLDNSELSQDEILKIIDENSDFDAVEIGGGEPFMHKDIVDIIRNIRERDKKLHVSTNATRIPEGFLELEDRLRQGSQIQISLHASNPELYQEITKKDLFNTVMENIERIKPKYSTLLSSSIYQANFNDVKNLINLGYELGLTVRINLVFPIGNGKNVDLLNSEQINELKSFLLLERIKKGYMIDSPLIHENNCIALQNFYNIDKKGSCPADLGKIYTNHKKEKHECEFLRG